MIMQKEFDVVVHFVGVWQERVTAEDSKQAKEIAEELFSSRNLCSTCQREFEIIETDQQMEIEADEVRE